MVDSNVRLIRLVDGSVLIARVVRSEREFLRVRNPMELCSEERGALLADYIPLSRDSQCDIDRRSVITTCAVQRDMETYYNNSVLMSSETTRNAINAVRAANERIRHALVGGDMDNTSVH